MCGGLWEDRDAMVPLYVYSFLYRWFNLMGEQGETDVIPKFLTVSFSHNTKV